MSKIHPNASSLIDDYIAHKEPFAKEICELLRKLVHRADNSITEDWKWNIPVFHKKSMVCGFAGFKKHVSLTFFNGSAINNKYRLFDDSGTGKNMRIIKITSITNIDKNQLLTYLSEAFLLNEIGVKKISNKKEIIVPDLLKTALNNNKKAKANFEKMAYTYRKEYALYISEAKRETTKQKRLVKVIYNLEQNIKMHEQYKC